MVTVNKTSALFLLRDNGDRLSKTLSPTAIVPLARAKAAEQQIESPLGPPPSSPRPSPLGPPSSSPRTSFAGSSNSVPNHSPFSKNMATGQELGKIIPLLPANQTRSARSPSQQWPTGHGKQ